MARGSAGRSIESSSRRLFLAALLALACGAGGAQQPAWNAVRGVAQDLAVASEDEVYAAGAGGALWRWVEGTTEWGPLAGSAKRLAAAAGMRLWAVDRDGALQRWTGTRWVALGMRARDVAVDGVGNGYAALADGRVARWTADGRGPTILQGSGASRLAPHPDGSLWVVLEDGAIERRVGGAARRVPGAARDIAASASGAVLIAAADGSLQRWDPASDAWQFEASGDFASVSVSPEGIPWAATTLGAIRTRAAVRPGGLPALEAASTSGPQGITFRRGGRGSGALRGVRSARRAASVALAPPAQRTDPAPFEFVDTLGTASALAIGQDGSVFAIGLDGGLDRWSKARRRFVDFPGALVRIAVDPGGNPWGVNQAGRVFRHTGTDWRQVRGTASDIAIAADGTVMTLSGDGLLGRYDRSIDAIVPQPGGQGLVSLALAPDGTPWGLLKDGTVVRCAELPCARLAQTAQEIAIGPDGSVFVVSFGNELRRFDRGSGLFQIIPVAGEQVSTVAVGPFGRPWVATTSGRVLASRFFDRDESVDLLTAGTTVTPTTGTGDVAPLFGPTRGGAFTFRKSMQFTDVSPFCNTDLHIGIGPEGSVVVVCEDGGIHVAWRWDPVRKAFAPMGTLPASFSHALDVDAESRLWLLDAAVDGRLLRQQRKDAAAYDTIAFPAGSGSVPLFERDLALGPDGAVYVVNSDGALYRAARQGSFSRLIAGRFVRVAVGTANDVWVVDADDVLYQIVAGRLEERAGSTFDVGAAADGSVYAIQQNAGDSVPMLYKWNASNGRFDRVNRSATRVDVAPNGRPWVLEESALRVYMAR